MLGLIQQKKITILNNHDEKLVGILHEAGSSEIVIVCHGFRSSKDHIPMVNLSAALGNEGISSFRFDFAGNGESEGVFRYGSYRREASDLRAVVQYFCRENRTVVAVIGHSKGGNAALLYASMYNDVFRVVNIAGRFDVKRGIEGRLGKDYLERVEQDGFIDIKNKRGKVLYRVTQESLTDRLTTDMQTVCLSIPNSCRVLTVHGSLDEMVPVEDAKEFDKYISNHKLHIIEGADHYYTCHQDELASLVLNFLNINSCTRREKVIHSRI